LQYQWKIQKEKHNLELTFPDCKYFRKLEDAHAGYILECLYDD